MIKSKKIMTGGVSYLEGEFIKEFLDEGVVDEVTEIKGGDANWEFICLKNSHSALR